MNVPSPSSSAATTRRSTPGSTQAPTSIEDKLRSYGISEEDENKWKEKYNRALLPYLRDDLFLELLYDIACKTDPATAEFESKLRSVMEQKSTDSQNEFHDQACKIMLPGAALFEKAQKLKFLSILDNEHTVYGIQAFVAHCLPSLIYEHTKHKPKCTPRKKRSVPRSKIPNIPSPGQGSRRRSNRIKQLKTPSV